MRSFLSTLALVGPFATTAVAAERTITFAVENMSCAPCPYVVQSSMAAVPGVVKVDVSFEKKTAVVTFDDAKTTTDAIGAASTNAGYPAQPVQPSSAVVWLGVRYEGGCAASSLCTVTAFFCTDDHLAAWRRSRAADQPGFRLSIEQALEVGRAIFGASLAGVDSKHPEAAEQARRSLLEPDITRGAPDG